jgi:GNAT superfamily N-acetyltransferase
MIEPGSEASYAREARMAPAVVSAMGQLLEEILDVSHPLWGEGLSRENYGRYNKAQHLTRWGSSNLERLALVDNGRLLSSAKRYRLRARVDGRDLKVLGIGAVFTPPAMRRRGHAGHLIERMVAEAADEGMELALLFSEIGTKYYARLGFEAVPLAQQALRIPETNTAPGVPIRVGDDRDAEAIAAIHLSRLDRYRFGLLRDPDLIRFGIAKKRLLAGLSPAGLRSVDFLVEEEGGRAAA